MAHRLDHIAGASLAFGANHRRALADAPQRFAQIAAAAHERHLEIALIDVMLLVGWGQHFALVNIIHPQRLEDAGLDKVTDAALRHHRDADRLDNLFDQGGVAHPRHAALRPNVSRHPLQGHHRHRTRLLGNAGLLGVDHIHNHSALEHLGQALLGGKGRFLHCLLSLRRRVVAPNIPQIM